MKNYNHFPSAYVFGEVANDHVVFLEYRGHSISCSYACNAHERYIVITDRDSDEIPKRYWTADFDGGVKALAKAVREILRTEHW